MKKQQISISFVTGSIGKRKSMIERNEMDIGALVWREL